MANDEYTAVGFTHKNIIRYACNRSYTLEGEADHSP